MMKMKISSPPINYFGAKYYMAEDIIRIFPSHKVFVEVFGGSGQVLFRKPRSPIEVYNDIDGDLVSFFSILRDKEKFQELHKRLQLTPYSRKEFKLCAECWKLEKDEIERARKWYVALMQSYSKTMGSKGWSHSKTISRRGMSQCTSQWLGKVDDDLPNAVERLRDVQIENLDYKELIEKYDSKDALFYLDPPYSSLDRTMSFKYNFEMTSEEHIKMAEILLKITGKAVLSGYDNSLYNNLIKNGWKKIFLGNFSKRSSSHAVKKDIGQEYLWINYDDKKCGNLFNE